MIGIDGRLPEVVIIQSFYGLLLIFPGSGTLEVTEASDLRCMAEEKKDLLITEHSIQLAMSWMCCSTAEKVLC